MLVLERSLYVLLMYVLVKIVKIMTVFLHKYAWPFSTTTTASFLKTRALECTVLYNFKKV